MAEPEQEDPILKQIRQSVQLNLDLYTDMIEDYKRHGMKIEQSYLEDQVMLRGILADIKGGTFRWPRA